ncbi:hypothetical protein A2467_02480 [Candidatus Nomurabacteria bacterium RIFOXYC2_FULL_36_8]|nr:MAG: hypothetical protein UR27_C0003G0099 [Candidatus Peregrinibacteria bacterium GW2011_GWA2_33_10]KKP40825.1 MAG: hypothetical protein UR30_C0004G0083 [Candidatus Peregrinibacteria bacterium GW2011_GWC2_33_13]OGJ11691.1 MAG: hypothetical protein A2467_02480 [Candidatus Nomurabacteria bacterium RIFOXYC2_FULL_36_8]OGJ47531.1 MAG: hypothetical protein A2229_03720 [Candidatus Peregrinibacteria bacterium RIFOXYA2_FULL_33_7]
MKDIIDLSDYSELSSEEYRNLPFRKKIEDVISQFIRHRESLNEPVSPYEINLISSAKDTEDLMLIWGLLLEIEDIRAKLGDSLNSIDGNKLAESIAIYLDEKERKIIERLKPYLPPQMLNLVSMPRNYEWEIENNRGSTDEQKRREAAVEKYKLDDPEPDLSKFGDSSEDSSDRKKRNFKKLYDAQLLDKPLLREEKYDTYSELEKFRVEIIRWEYIDLMRRLNNLFALRNFHELIEAAVNAQSSSEVLEQSLGFISDLENRLACEITTEQADKIREIIYKDRSNFNLRQLLNLIYKHIKFDTGTHLGLKDEVMPVIHPGDDFQFNNDYGNFMSAMKKLTKIVEVRLEPLFHRTEEAQTEILNNDIRIKPNLVRDFYTSEEAALYFIGTILHDHKMFLAYVMRENPKQTENNEHSNHDHLNLLQDPIKGNLIRLKIIGEKGIPEEVDRFKGKIEKIFEEFRALLDSQYLEALKMTISKDQSDEDITNEINRRTSEFDVECERFFEQLSGSINSYLAEERSHVLDVSFLNEKFEKLKRDYERDLRVNLKEKLKKFKSQARSKFKHEPDCGGITNKLPKFTDSSYPLKSLILNDHDYPETDCQIEYKGFFAGDLIKARDEQDEESGLYIIEGFGMDGEKPMSIKLRFISDKSPVEFWDDVIEYTFEDFANMNPNIVKKWGKYNPKVFDYDPLGTEEDAENYEIKKGPRLPSYILEKIKWDLFKEIDSIEFYIEDFQLPENILGKSLFSQYPGIKLSRISDDYLNLNTDLRKSLVQGGREEEVPYYSDRMETLY